MKLFPNILFFVATLVLAGCHPSLSPPMRNWEQSIVTIKIDGKKYDYFQPWSSAVESFEKSGVVVDSHEILTTALGLKNSTVIRLKKEGHGRWWNAEISWLDDRANLALLKVADADFWTGLQPVSIATSVPRRGPVHIRRWVENNLEDWSCEITKLIMDQSGLGFHKLLKLVLTTKMNSGGFSEVVTDSTSLIGFVDPEGMSILYGILQALPSSYIKSVLEARAQGKYHGVGYFDFQWQPAQNPATLQFLGQNGAPQGVIITNVPKTKGDSYVFHPRDVLLEIDGFHIDTDGIYDDPQYGSLSFEYLAVRDKWAGDSLHCKIWRDGKPQDVLYPLPAVTSAPQLVPYEDPSQEPEYVIIGGLVFQPLILPYLKGFGDEWTFRSPFRLSYYTYQQAALKRPHVVFLSQVLPDSYNLGYQNDRYLALESINGKPIHQLSEVLEAFQHPSDGFHILEFAPGKEHRRMILDAANLETATQRVLEHYGIQQDHFLNIEPVP